MSISLDLRERILKAHETGEGSIRKLSKRFCVGTNTIFILLKRYKKTGDLEAISPPGRARKIDKREEKVLKKVIEKENDLTLEELCEEFAKKTSVNVSVPTMYRACERMKLKYKKNGIPSRTKPT